MNLFCIVIVKYLPLFFFIYPLLSAYIIYVDKNKHRPPCKQSSRRPAEQAFRKHFNCRSIRVNGQTDGRTSVLIYSQPTSHHDTELPHRLPLIHYILNPPRPELQCKKVNVTVRVTALRFIISSVSRNVTSFTWSKKDRERRKEEKQEKTKMK